MLEGGKHGRKCPINDWDEGDWEVLHLRPGPLRGKGPMNKSDEAGLWAGKQASHYQRQHECPCQVRTYTDAMPRLVSNMK